MDSQGYIPLSSIAAFNRVKSLSQDAELIIAAVKHSKELELNTIREDGNLADIANILVRPKTDPLKWPLASPDNSSQSHLNPDVPEFVPKTSFNSGLKEPAPSPKKNLDKNATPIAVNIPKKSWVLGLFDSVYCVYFYYWPNYLVGQSAALSTNDFDERA